MLPRKHPICFKVFCWYFVTCVVFLKLSQGHILGLSIFRWPAHLLLPSPLRNASSSSNPVCTHPPMQPWFLPKCQCAETHTRTPGGTSQQTSCKLLKHLAHLNSLINHFYRACVKMTLRLSQFLSRLLSRILTLWCCSYSCIQPQPIMKSNSTNYAC